MDEESLSPSLVVFLNCTAHIFDNSTDPTANI